MIRCVAIDDEPLALLKLETYIKRVPMFELVACCHDAYEAMATLAEHEVDALFVDINMPDLNGLDFVRSLVHRPIVVFTTAYSQYAIDGYKVDAIDYLLKPFGLDDFQRAANKVIAQWKLLSNANAATASMNKKDESEEEIFFKTDYKRVKVRVKDIIIVEAMSEYLRIYVEGEAKSIITLLSMKRIEEHLPSDRFMRIHRSYIVNLNKIQDVSKLVVHIAGKSIPVGDSYKDRFLKYLEEKSLGR